MEDTRSATLALANIALELCNAMLELQDRMPDKKPVLDDGRRIVIADQLRAIGQALDYDELELAAQDLRY